MIMPQTLRRINTTNSGGIHMKNGWAKVFEDDSYEAMAPITFADKVYMEEANTYEVQEGEESGAHSNTVANAIAELKGDLQETTNILEHAAKLFFSATAPANPEENWIWIKL
jgi:hypothetical protein